MAKAGRAPLASCEVQVPVRLPSALRASTPKLGSPSPQVAHPRCTSYYHGGTHVGTQLLQHLKARTSGRTLKDICSTRITIAGQALQSSSTAGHLSTISLQEASRARRERLMAPERTLHCLRVPLGTKSLMLISDISGQEVIPWLVMLSAGNQDFSCLRA